MTIDWLVYFTDPVLRAPTIGCILIGFASSLVGMLMLLKKQSLIGEVLSHTAFPGIILGAALTSLFTVGEYFNLFVMASAAVGCIAGNWAVSFLKKRMRIKSDAALCFTLAVFFGLGVLFASKIQSTHVVLYKQALLFLYGQVATMTDAMLILYTCLAILTVSIIVLLYHPIQAVLFDRQFANIVGLKTTFIDLVVSGLLILAIVIGMRSVGVVLMAGMLIAPAIAARAWTNRLWLCLLLAALFGVFSSYFGNVLSVEGAKIIALHYPGWKFSLPTGPLILLFAAALAVISIFLAPSGILARYMRMARFRRRMAKEHFLKALWRKGKRYFITRKEIRMICEHNQSMHRVVLHDLIRAGLLTKEVGGLYSLSDKGWAHACHIVRLHRLWEVYLVKYLSQGVDRVHRSAEELEHVMSPELERELEKLLGDLDYDPHRQPIPTRREATW